MLSQVIARFALAAALVLAGQAALLHPLTHVDQDGALVHAMGGKSQNQDKAASRLCDVLAALMAVASGPILQFAVPVSMHFLPAFSAGELRISGAPPFLSQGPPALL